jgi:hypothetical protein
MCNAYDLAWATAHLYFKDRPHLVSIDDIHFVYPVSLGSLLTFDAYVITLVFVHETLSPPPPHPLLGTQMRVLQRGRTDCCACGGARVGAQEWHGAHDDDVLHDFPQGRAVVDAG